ncbi:type I restriction endonuclease EcoAI [Bacteroidia bacterium]|nr:type I restriction endonuclease EcoAI [Bacteroidia bacterium]
MGNRPHFCFCNTSTSFYKSPYEKFADGTVKCIEDEIPFEIPESWEWVRLGNISNHNTGKTLDKGRNTGILREYITTSNLYWGFFELDELRKMPIKEDELDRFTAVKGDLLICEGGEAGRSAIWDKDNSICFQNHIHRVRFFANIRSLYVYFFLRKIYFTGEINKYRKGVGIQSLSGDSLSSILLPLPPLAEQYRIVSEIERLFSVIDLIEENNRSLEQIIRQAKSKVLDLAIHGKLVPQDPNDEPASVLLERIKAEQKTKKQTADNSHYPFEIPDSWVWMTGNECFVPMETKKPIGEKFGYIDINAIDNKKHIISEIKYLNVLEAPSRASRHVNSGDTLFSMVRPYLENIAFVDDKYSNCIASTGFFVCKPTQILFPKYLYYLMTSKYVIDGLNAFMKGDNSPSINNENITSYRFPIPPLSEQKRIVNQIEAIFKTLDSIQNNL